MTAEEYIENECFVVVNPDYPVISKENALKAVEISANEERQRAIEAYKQCCQYNVNGGCEYGGVSSPCRMRCLTCAQFIKHLK